MVIFRGKNLCKNTANNVRLTLLGFDFGTFLVPLDPIFTAGRFMCFTQALPGSTRQIMQYIQSTEIEAPLAIVNLTESCSFLGSK